MGIEAYPIEIARGFVQGKHFHCLVRSGKYYYIILTMKNKHYQIGASSPSWYVQLAPGSQSFPCGA